MTTTTWPVTEPATIAVTPETTPAATQDEDSFELLVRSFMQANACAHCHSVGPAHRCGQCLESSVFCAEHLLEHHTVIHAPSWRSRVAHAVNLAPPGIISAVTGHHWMVEPDGSIGSRKGPQPAIMAAFRHHFADGVVVNVNRPADDPAATAEVVENFFENAGIRPWAVYKAEGGAAFVCLSNEAAADVPAVFINPETKPGKASKRVRNITGTANWSAAWRVSTPPQAGHFTVEPIPGDTIHIRVIKTRRNAGDGMSVMPWSRWVQLAQTAGLAPERYDYGYAVAAVMGDRGLPQGLKAMVIPVSDEDFHSRYGREVDWVIDSQSVNQDVGVPGTGLLRFDFRATPYHRIAMLEPMMHGLQVQRTLHMDEVQQVAQRVTAQARRDVVLELMDEYYASAEPQAELSARDNVDAAYDRILSRGTVNERSLLERPTALAGYSAGHVFGSPAAMHQFSAPLTGTLSRGLAGWKAGTQIPMDQKDLVHVCAEMLGVPIPKPGYARVIPHPVGDKLEMGDAPWGVCFNPGDLADRSEELDGADCDTDKITVVAVQGMDGKPYIMPNRLPASIGAGKLKRLALDNAKWLRQRGVHFYTQAGMAPFQDSLGAEDRLKAAPVEPIPYPGIDAQPWQFLFQGPRKGLMGAVCLAMWVLARSGGYDPAQHKVNFSEQVIDAMHNGVGDPTPILTALENAIIDHILAGDPVEQCYYHRIRQGLEIRYTDRMLAQGLKKDEIRPLADLVKLEHGPWCESLIKTRKGLVDETIHGAETRVRMASGPSEQLVSAVGDDVWNMAASAVQYWNDRWSDSFRDGEALRRAAWKEQLVPWDALSAAGAKHLRDRGVKPGTELTPDMATALSAEITSLASKATADRMAQAYAKAQELDAPAGTFTQAVVQAHWGRANNARKPKGDYSQMLRAVSPDDVAEYYHRTPVRPTVVIIPKQNPDVILDVRRNGEPVHGRGAATLRRQLQDEDPEIAMAMAQAQPGDKVRVDLDGRFVAEVKTYANNQAEKLAKSLAEANLQPGATYQVGVKGANGQFAVLCDADGVQALDLQADAKRFVGMPLTYVGAIPARHAGQYRAAFSPLVFETPGESILLTVPPPDGDA